MDTTYVLWDGIPRHVLRKGQSELSGVGLLTLAPIYGLCPLECVTESDCVPITEDTAAIIDGVEDLRGEELVERHRELRRLREESKHGVAGGKRERSRMQGVEGEVTAPRAKLRARKPKEDYSEALAFFNLDTV